MPSFDITFATPKSSTSTCACCKKLNAQSANHQANGYVKADASVNHMPYEPHTLMAVKSMDRSAIALLPMGTSKESRAQTLWACTEKYSLLFSKPPEESLHIQ